MAGKVGAPFGNRNAVGKHNMSGVARMKRFMLQGGSPKQHVSRTMARVYKERGKAAHADNIHRPSAMAHTLKWYRDMVTDPTAWKGEGYKTHLRKTGKQIANKFASRSRKYKSKFL